MQIVHAAPEDARAVAQIHVAAWQSAYAAILPAVLAHFGAVPGVPRLVTELCLFTQPGPGAPFLIAERFPLEGT